MLDFNCTHLRAHCSATAFLAAFWLLLGGIPASATSSDDLDIGAPKIAGGTTFSRDTYSISGCGTNIWNTSDQFHFNKSTLSGNGTVTARVVSVGGTDKAAKSGVMLRGDVSPGSVFADVVVTPAAGLLFQSRTHTGANCISTQIPGVHAPVWIKLARQGTRISGSYSINGVNWKQIGMPRSMVFGKTVLAGAVVTSHNPAVLSTSRFASLAVTPEVDARYLHTAGNQVRDRSGRPVALRGVNIGGWLVTEGWMCGQSDTPGSSKTDPFDAADPHNSGRFALEQLEARFGTTPAAAFIDIWRDHWFTDRDMDNIQSYGFNLIRIPFSWRNLQDAEGHWYRGADGQIDFSRFDWVVQEAAKRNIYVIFVYHIWPGQQKNYSDICQAGDLGISQRAQSASLWSALSRHFKGNGTIAAYDLINEPTGSNDFYAAHRSFYAAIRTQEPERMLTAEWVNTADFPKLGWTNTLCSGHYPAGNKVDFDKFLAELPKHNEYSTLLPCFVGECKSDDSSHVAQNAADMTEAMNRLHWPWATWTYKTVNAGGWGLFDYDNSVKYKLRTDAESTLRSKWSTDLTRWQRPALPVNYSLQSEIIAGLRRGSTSPLPD